MPQASVRRHKTAAQIFALIFPNAAVFKFTLRLDLRDAVFERGDGGVTFSDCGFEAVGTGSFRPTLSPKEAMRSSAIGLAIKSLAVMIAESQMLVLTLMTYLGQSPVAWPINSEIGDLGSLTAPTGNLFRYLRYDIRLEQSWLEQKLGKHFSADFIAKLRPMDNPANMRTLYELGQSAAADQVKREDLMFAKV